MLDACRWMRLVLLLLSELDQAQELLDLKGRGMSCAARTLAAAGLAASEQRQRKVLVGDLPLELAAAQEELELVSQKPNSNLID